MKSSHRARSVLLCLILVLSLLPGVFLFFAAATAADDQEEALLGTLSAQFEASGPGVISSGSGDAGGKSYGSYQFSSASNVPKSFFEWCQSSTNAYYKSIGDRLSDAYYDGGAGYGTNFDTAWKALASEDADGFERVQRNYVRRSYYEPIVSSIESSVSGFKMSNYSIALRNVFWSRSVQHGAGGAKNVITRAFDALGGFANQSESILIDAIYAESGAVVDNNTPQMSGTTAEKYGVSGKTLKYYDGCSADVQLGVYTRLRVNEPALAQNMLAAYGYADAPIAEGIYRLLPSDNSSLAAVAGSSAATLNGVADSDTQRFRLTYYASGYYTIESVASGKRLTAGSDGTVTLSAPTANDNQLWKLASFNSGFSVQNRSTNQYLTVSSAAAGGQLKAGSTAMQWQISQYGANWRLEGGIYPSYSTLLPAGSSSFPFRGTLRCGYTIKTVKVSILNASGKEAISSVSASPNATSYNLGLMDDDVAFSALGAGSYTLVVTATSNAPTDSTYTLKSSFYVSDGNYYLTFDPCGGTCSESSRKLSAGQVYGTLPTATKSGYTFDGWYTAQSGGTKVSGNTVAAAANTVVYAHYSRTYTYTFLNGDGSVLVTGQLPSGSVIPAPSQTPTRSSDSQYYYTFTGWSGYTSGSTKISADVTFQPEFASHALSSLNEIVSSTYKISDSYLRAIPNGTSASTLLKNLAPADGVAIHKGASAASGTVGTGMTVDYTQNGKLVQTLTVVVTGDINGDGKCTLTDMVQLRSHLLGKSKLSGAALQAADINGDGQCTLTDMVQCLSVQLGRTSIKPN